MRRNVREGKADLHITNFSASAGSRDGICAPGPSIKALHTTSDNGHRNETNFNSQRCFFGGKATEKTDFI